ncbi:MAG: DUF4912 domain-containing protein [bacterium]
MVFSETVKGRNRNKKWSFIDDDNDLPKYYDNTRLTLMPRDPYSMYAYWEVASTSLISLQDRFDEEEISEKNIILRIYDVTGIDFTGSNANNFFDIEVGVSKGNQYINLWSDNVSYIGEIGVKSTSEVFFNLARSNFIHIPRLGCSPRTEQIWMKVTDKKCSDPYVIPKLEEPSNIKIPLQEVFQQEVEPVIPLAAPMVNDEIQNILQTEDAQEPVFSPPEVSHSPTQSINNLNTQQPFTNETHMLKIGTKENENPSSSLIFNNVEPRTTKQEQVFSDETNMSFQNNTKGNEDLISPLILNNEELRTQSQERVFTAEDFQPITNEGGRGGLLSSPRLKLVSKKTLSKRMKRNIFLTNEDIRCYYSRLTPLIRHIISVRLPKLGKYSFSIGGEREEERREIYGRLSKGDVVKKILLGASENLAPLGTGEYYTSGHGGSDAYIGKNIQQRKFFFEVSNELVIHGRTEPDTEVWLGDKKIQLHQDGTFSLRFALEDGKIPFEFKAISKDKTETRRVRTYVEKFSSYA